MSPAFEWDLRKAETNLRKHRISFAEALTVFSDSLGRIFPECHGRCANHQRPACDEDREIRL